MVLAQPGVDDVERAITELLREEEVGALAVLDAQGFPTTTHMHIAADGLTAYFHTFTYTRKYAALQRDPRVGYTIAHVPTDGFAGRTRTRALQVTGVASFVTDPGEVERVVELSREQFAWLKDSGMYDNFRRAGVKLRQVFFKVRPIEGMWEDHRVRMLYRTLVTFTPDGKHIAGLAPYDMRGPAVDTVAVPG